MSEYIILKTAQKVAEKKGISLYEAFLLPYNEFWNAGITI